MRSLRPEYTPVSVSYSILNSSLGGTPGRSSYNTWAKGKCKCDADSNTIYRRTESTQSLDDSELHDISIRIQKRQKKAYIRNRYYVYKIVHPHVPRYPIPCLHDLRGHTAWPGQCCWHSIRCTTPVSNKHVSRSHLDTEIGESNNSLLNIHA